MGCPVVSTSIGIEGLAVTADEHFVLRDDATGFADAVVALLGDATSRHAIATRARHCVEANFGHRAVSQVFERACLDALGRFHSQSRARSSAAAMVL